MKTIIVLLIGISVVTNLFSQASTAYLMKKIATDSITVNRDLSVDEDISLTTINNEITGFSISGNIVLIDNTSLVRIILRTTNHELLVYEAYPLICEDKTFYIDKLCEETGLLNEETPVELMIIVRNALFEFDKIHYSTQNLSPIENGNYNSITIANKKTIEKEKATIINLNNSRLHKTWFADTIKTSFLTFEQKKNLFGGNNDYFSYGFEYYSAGIFSFPDFDPNTAERSETKTTYVTSFDWRDRHGKNWMTSIKDQDDCGACAAFSAVGATEAMFNIYYNNDNIDLDISEQNIFSCKNGSCASGMSLNPAVTYFLDSGVVDEDCFPYVDSGPPPCSDTCSSPDYIVHISSKQTISGTTDGLKNAIINIGPLAGQVNMNPNLHHGMALLGYNEISIGDTIQYCTGYGMIDSVIGSGNPLIGLTYWIFKNSYGIRQPGQWYYHANGGYIYAFVQNISSISGYTTEAPYSTLTYERNCTDADNDGYYWWGTGSKPATCPSCSPDSSDCDDSDPLIGAIDAYGNCTVISEPYEADHVIDTTVTWSNTSICGDVFVISGGNLTIDNTEVNIYNEFSVEIGGTLTITEGEIK